MSSEDVSGESESYNEEERRPARSARPTRLRKLNESRHKGTEEASVRVLRPKKQTFVAADHGDDVSEEEAPPGRLLIKVLSPAVESVHSRKAEAGKRLYLVKMAGKALTKCVWLEEAELLESDVSLKTKLKRFDAVFNAVAWEPSAETRCIGIDAESTTVDRVLDSSDIFSQIHPKKASDLRGKWGEGLVRVLRALVNFEVDQVLYGVFYVELGALYRHFPEFADALDFGMVNNRVYLDFYQTPERFWDDLEQIYRSVERLAGFLDEKSDIRVLNDRMRQLTARLYQEWANNVRLEAEVFAAKMTENGFVEAVEKARKEFEAAKESESVSPAQVVRIFDRFRHVLRFSNHVGDRSFAEAVAQVDAMKQALKSDPNPAQSPSKQILEIPEVPLTALADRERLETPESFLETANGAMEVEHGNQPVPKSMQNRQSEQPTPVSHPTETIPTPSSHLKPSDSCQSDSIPPIVQDTTEFVTKILTFAMEKLGFIDSVLSKVYWNDFLRQVHRLSSLPRHLATLAPIDWATDAQLAALGTNLETLYLVKWQGGSYADATWERESELSDFDAKLRDFKRHTRAMDRESRKAYTSRCEAFLELRRYAEEPRLVERASAQQLSDLRQRLFPWKDPKGVVPYTPKNQPIFKNERTLRSYQLESLNWMIDAWAHRRNVILADEMGLGKTIQAMAFLNHLISFEHQTGPYLVIAPLSTLSHWKRTFEDWTHLNAVLYYDAKGRAGREVCQSFEFNHWDITMRGLFVKDNNIPRFSILVTSYEVFLQDFDVLFRNLPFQHVIIDEAHKLKNKNAKIISVLRRVVCQRFLLLTGTPIQNNLAELWSLLHFIEPGVFPDLSRFLAEYQTGQDMESLTRLQDALKPYLLRRMKEDVESSIPPLTETIIDIELTSVQKMVYKTLYEKNKGTLQKGAGVAGISIMNNLEMQLRKCCNHPFTLTDVAESLTRECASDQAYFDKLVTTSGKMIFLDKALGKFGREGKKVLIFSQFTEVLRLLEEYLDFLGIRHFKIDGSTKARERQVSIDKFNTQAEFEVFLLSTKAGGVGINLTSASVVVIFDSDWNPQNDIQAIARAHRIGQTNEVKVFRLISKKTYESEMFERASVKLGLDQAIILASNFVQRPEAGNDDFSRRKLEEIETLLRKGAIGLITEQPEGEGDAQFSQNIDDIIQNARTASYSVINKLYTFGKTKFVGDAKDELLQIDDPDFWKKAFANQKTTMDNFEREYQTLAHGDKSRKIELQKSFFLRLSEEIYRYLNERVTNEGFNADTEMRFSGLLIQVADNNQFHMVIRELAGQLNTDFNKSGRRIKRINEKTLNSMLKLASADPIARREANGALLAKGSDSETDRNGPSKKRRGDRHTDPGENGFSNPDSRESELFENEDEKALLAFKQAKKALQEKKARLGNAGDKVGGEQSSIKPEKLPKQPRPAKEPKPPKPVKERPPPKDPRPLSSRKVKAEKKHLQGSQKTSDGKTTETLKIDRTKDCKTTELNRTNSDLLVLPIAVTIDIQKNVNSDETQLGKRASPPSSEKPKSQSKKLKESAETNQRLPFSLYKPFDFSTYQKFTVKFHDSPLGPETLCDEHKKLLDRNRISLKRYKNDYQPIDVRKNTESAYLELMESRRVGAE